MGIGHVHTAHDDMDMALVALLGHAWYDPFPVQLVRGLPFQCLYPFLELGHIPLLSTLFNGPGLMLEFQDLTRYGLVLFDLTILIGIGTFPLQYGKIEDILDGHLPVPVKGGRIGLHDLPGVFAQFLRIVSDMFELPL